MVHVDLDALHGTKSIVERSVEGGRRAGKIYSQGPVRGAFISAYASCTAEWSLCFPRSPSSTPTVRQPFKIACTRAHMDWILYVRVHVRAGGHWG